MLKRMTPEQARRAEHTCAQGLAPIKDGEKMTDEIGTHTSAVTVPGGLPQKRHWWRWILASVVVIVALVVLAIGFFVKLQPAPRPLALPTAASAAVGPLDGTWAVAAGSVAGFRVQERFVGMSNDVVGRTTAVTGTVVVSGGRVTKAAFRIDLTAIKVNGKSQPQFAKSLDVLDHPSATFTLTHPVTLSSAFASGAPITVTATGQLAMRGSSHLVILTLTGRRAGLALQAAGSFPIEFSSWGIIEPKGYGFFGSLANHGVAEFLLALHRR